MNELSFDRRDFFKWTAAGLAIAGAWSLGGKAQAIEGHSYSRGQRGLVTFFIQNKEELGLSDDQVNRLKAIREGFRKTSARIGADLETAYEQFHDLMQEDEIKLNEIEKASKRIETLEGEQRVEFAKAIADGKRVLTKEQLKKAKDLRRKSTEPAKS